MYEVLKMKMFRHLAMAVVLALVASKIGVDDLERRSEERRVGKEC